MKTPWGKYLPQTQFLMAVVQTGFWKRKLAENCVLVEEDIIKGRESGWGGGTEWRRNPEPRLMFSFLCVGDAPFDWVSFLSIIVNTVERGVCLNMWKSVGVWVCMWMFVFGTQNKGGWGRGEGEGLSGKMYKNLLNVYWKLTIKWASVQCK